jgi:hypothetical protein
MGATMTATAAMATTGKPARSAIPDPTMAIRSGAAADPAAQELEWRRSPVQPSSLSTHPSRFWYFFSRLFGDRFREGEALA